MCIIILLILIQKILFYQPNTLIQIKNLKKEEKLNPLDIICGLLLGKKALIIFYKKKTKFQQNDGYFKKLYKK